MRGANNMANVYGANDSSFHFDTDSLFWLSDLTVPFILNQTTSENILTSAYFCRNFSQNKIARFFGPCSLII